MMKTLLASLALAFALAAPVAQAQPTVPGLTHRYSFAADGADSVAGANGILQGNAIVTNGSLVLDGVGGFLDLPNNLFTGYSSVTFETWVTDNGSSPWARVWDFGNSTGGEGLGGTGSNYMFLTLPSGGGILRVAFTPTNSAGEQLVNWAGGRPAVGQLAHIVFTLDSVAQLGSLYVDSALVGSNAAFTVTPAAVGTTLNNWLGRSQFSGDPYFNGSIDEFRVYNVALSPATILQNYQAGPNKFLLGPVYFVQQPQSTNALQSRPATFSADVDGTMPYTFQWYRNGLALPGQTNLSLTVTADLTNHNASYQLRATNVYSSTLFSAVSSNAVLTVTPDTNAPVLLQAQSASTNGVGLLFSEPIRADTATNVSNFTLTGPGGGIVISAASLSTDGTQITLTTPPLLVGSSYTVTVSNVRDLTGNLIAPGTQTNFIAALYSLQDIGSPVPPGAMVSSSNGLVFTGAGAGIGGTADQFSFAYQTLSGDFDVQVRLGSLGLTDPWATAGLMARDGLLSNSMFAASLATPSQTGCFFLSRNNVGAAAVSSGFFQVNYPNTWLRLQRVGNVFTGYASLDAQSWTQLGALVFTASASLDVGIAVSSHHPAQTTSVVFSDAGPTVNPLLATVPPALEPIGPSSRRTGLAFSEIMYHPLTITNFGSLEFIEIYNSELIAEDMTGYRLFGAIDYDFPPGTLLPSGAFLVIARNPTAVEAHYGITGVLGPFTNSLPNDTGIVRLRNELDSVLLEVEYHSTDPWPVAADGAGHSIVLSRPSYGENDPRAWAASDTVGGSPGRGESLGAEPFRGVMINEILAHTDLPDVDSIELFNTTTQPLNLNGCILTDDPDTNKFVITNLVIGPRGFLYFTEAQLGFNLNAAGETIYLKNPGLTRILDAVRFEAQENGVSFGRYPDGGDQWYRLSTKTFGSTNSAPRVSQVGINEIMYNPISGLDDDQYVELYNRGSNAVNLTGWSFVSGISFTFPTNTVVPANGFLVVAKNPARMLTNYTNLNATNTVGNFGGKLSHNGERLALAMPDTIASTNAQGQVVTNLIAIVVDEVTYGTAGRWGRWADGGGSSLELIDPRTDKRQAANWADSDETAKAPWTLIERTAPLLLGMSTSGQAIPNRFEFFLEGPGECLVDNMELFTNGAPGNLIGNGDFESGKGVWAFQGTHARSTVETGGAFAGTQSLHVRASERGDTGANRIRTGITTLTVNGTNQATMRTRARWLCGTTNLLLRIRGNWMECTGGMTLPSNLGTPGLPNSRLVPNAGPAIRQVSHYPILPAFNQAALVTARVSDPDGTSGVTLYYRVDPNTTYTAVPMTDNGAGGDAIANDGIYTASIPSPGAFTLVAFYIQAQDAHAPPANTLFPPDPAAPECLVRFGESLPAGNLGTYRLWVTSTNINYWTSREKNSNEGIDATFVYGNWRVIYNAQTRYGGSPWHTPGYTGPFGTGAALCNYDVVVPGDDLFLGDNGCGLASQDFVDHGTFNNDSSGQAEATAHWMARKIGIRPDYRRYVRVFLDGQQRGLFYYDAQQPDGATLKEFFPNDSNGHLHKIEDWFEFDDNGAGQNIITTKLINNVVNGQKRTERYRWNFRPRAAENPNDFSDLFALVDGVNAPGPEPYTSAVLNLVNMRNWMRMFAVQHMAGDWDSYGYRRGKNMFTYKPQNGRWEMLLWDIQQVLSKGSDGTTQNLFDLGNTNATDQGDPLIWRMYNHPPFVREFWSAMQDLVNGPMLPENYAPPMDARVSALLANGVQVTTTSGIKSWINGRRAYILTQIPQAAFAVSGPPAFSSSSNSVTLTGTAPIGADRIVVNGGQYPLTWTTVTNWSLRVALGAGTNVLSFQALDFNGNTVSNGIANLIVNYTGATVAPSGNIVFNELMHHPALDGAEYVELYNRNSSFTFDLSNWRINGLGYTFPPGSILLPQSYLLLAKDPWAYALAYGVTSNSVFDQYNGNLQANGETLTLIKPGLTPEADVTVAKVRYETNAPWPAAVLQPGTSLQLIDAAQDNWRLGNWTFGQSNAPPPTAQWIYVTATGTASSSVLYMYLQSAGDIYLDDIKLVAGSVAESGVNVLSNGGFETALTGPWSVSADFTTSVLSPNFVHAGANSLHMIATAAGSGNNDSIQQTISPSLTTNATYTLSFWYRQTTNGGPLTLRLSGSGLVATVSSLAPPSAGPTLTATPGAPNSVAASIPAFPPLWINELQAENLTGITNSAGQRTAWLELFNPTSNTVSLNGLYLSKNPSNLTAWAFPSTAAISAGQFKVVFADSQTNLSTTNELHANFTLPAGSGMVTLSRIYNSQTQVLDYVSYAGLAANRSFGSFPDGQSFDRQQFFYVTPGGTNNGISAPLSVFINEWLADNSHALADPADNKFEDWFEIYNPGAATVDLGGYYLTDNLSNKFQFLVPNNAQYVIPSHGFLLVWADNETNQNNASRPDLHASFALSKGGEAIGIFAADGTPIDFVSFGPQTTDVTQGRYPDGGPLIYFLNAPTPRTNNLFVNTAPSLAPIGDRVITLGQNVSFTASASDVDAPPQSLSYALGGGAPPGAYMDAAGGFSWTPSTAPATNTVMLTVADNGTPSLGTNRSFTVIVLPPPSLTGVSASAGQFSMSWQSRTGTKYQVVYKTDLNDPVWIPVGGQFTGNGAILTFMDAIITSTNRYFCLQIVP